MPVTLRGTAYLRVAACKWTTTLSHTTNFLIQTSFEIDQYHTPVLGFNINILPFRADQARHLPINHYP
jgi:hypothetical protein